MASPFDGEIFTFVNPDGSEVTVRGWGNQFEAVFETLDGYTVVQGDDGYYQYAKLSDDGESLVPSGTRVAEAGREAPALPKHIRLPREATRAQAERAEAAMGSVPRWMERRQQDRARRIAQPPEGLAPEGSPEGPGGAPPSTTTTGDYLGLVLLIDFSDFPQTIGRQEVDDFCNKPGYSGFGNNGSAFDYFRDVSDGKLRYKNQVPAYFRAAHPRTYYTNPAIAYGTRAQELIREALDGLVASGFDFSGLTADSGGFIQALSVFYAGARSNAWSQGLWPHAWGLASDYVVGGGRRFRDYQITDLGDQLTLRTFCHENGHMVCDFPDLYDYDSVNVGYGVGHYSLMCYGGADKNPTQVDAYLKHAAGWASRVTTLASGMTATVEAGKNDFLIHAKNASEYFILENRRQSGRDATLPDAGVAIWHVDVNGNNSHEQMTPSKHYECSLEQSDNRFDLERKVNAGDAEDLYGGAASTFGAATAPNSNWWDGSASGLEIEQISAVGASMTVTTRGTTPQESVYGGKDIALVRQLPGWGSIPVAFANGDGSWNVTNGPVTDFITSWANQPGVKVVAGDFNGNGLTDLALVRQTPGWGSIPIAFANGDGTWNVTNGPVTDFITSWANQPGVKVIAGDFNGNGLTDLALVRQTPGWGSIPIAFANGDGTWNVTNGPVTDFITSWANQPGVKVIAGDFNGNGLTDLALVRQTPGWGSIPIAFANGDGTWNITNGPVTDFITSWANQPGVKVIAGDFNGNGLTDLALVRQTPGWGSIPIAFANGDGTWNITNGPVTDFITSWANQPGVKVIAGDFNGNGLTDLALVRQTPGWGSIPIAFANGDGTWNITNGPVTDFITSWANQPGVKVIAGDFTQNGLTDLALVRQTPGWSTIPVAASNGDGNWTITNGAAPDFIPSWANTPGVRLITGDYR